MAEEKIKDDEVKIADKNLEVYLGECILRFQSRDQLILSAGNKEKAKEIICFLNTLGVVADREFVEGEVDYRQILKKYAEGPFSDEIKISDRDIRVYLGSVAKMMLYKDKLILSAGQGFVEKMRYTANILNALGIVVDKDYRNGRGGMEVKDEKCEVFNKDTGRKEIKVFYKLGITKIPEICLDKTKIRKGTGELYFKEEECEIQNRATGRKEIKVFYKLGITKIPEIYMYTNPDRAIEYPELKED